MTVQTTAFPRQRLADWCREDGHEGCAVLIEESPEVILPSVLWWVSRHVEAHPVYDDCEAGALPRILRDEADAIRSRRGTATITHPTALATGACIFATACLLYAVVK